MNNDIYKIVNNKIEDIFISGFLEKEENGFIFHPLYDNIYIICSGNIYKIFLSGDNIDAIIVPKITPYFKVDEDDIFAKSSIYIQLFNTEFPVKVLGVSIDKMPLSPLYIKIKGCDNEFILKVDPKNTFGLSISYIEG